MTDIDKIPKLVDDIKEEVKAACPKLVLDGSRPFRVHWRSMADDHVSVVVDTHHDIPPMTQLFYDNQERVMIAIATAVKKNGMKFALPAKISYREPVVAELSKRTFKLILWIKYLAQAPLQVSDAFCY